MSVRVSRSSKCPGCGSELDTCTEWEEREEVATCINNLPKPGDAGICGHCGTFLVISPTFVFRLMTLEEVGELTDDQRIELQRARRRIEAEHPEQQ